MRRNRKCRITVTARCPFATTKRAHVLFIIIYFAIFNRGQVKRSQTTVQINQAGGEGQFFQTTRQLLPVGFEDLTAVFMVRHYTSGPRWWWGGGISVFNIIIAALSLYTIIVIVAVVIMMIFIALIIRVPFLCCVYYINRCIIIVLLRRRRRDTLLRLALADKR